MRVDIKGTPCQKSAEAYKKVEDDILVQKLKTASFAEIDTWVDSNIINLASARALLKKMLLIMSYLLNKK
jgi:hypothetical protein